jgi:hypothetical protein
VCSNGSLPSKAILKDNLTLFGYDLRFRAEESGVGEASRSSAAYLVDASAMVFLGNIEGECAGVGCARRTGTIELFSGPCNGCRFPKPARPNVSTPRIDL